MKLQHISWSIAIAFTSLLIYFCSWTTIFLLSLVYAFLFYWVPIQSEPVDTSNAPKNLIHNRFNERKLDGEEEVDVVIIGSGISGLTCGAILSRMGKKVVILEQHTVLGGGAHVYELGNYKFDSGLHYVMEVNRYLTHLACGGRSPPVQFGAVCDSENVIDKIVLGNEAPFDIKDRQKYIPDLYKMFPEEKKALDDFFQKSNTVYYGFALWMMLQIFPTRIQKILASIFLRSYMKLVGQTTKQVLSNITKNKKLASILCGTWHDAGSPPHICTFLMHSLVFTAYSRNGARYPVGGSEEIVKALAYVIQKNGGKAFVRAKVKEINVDIEKGYVTGVTLADGVTVPCKTVISSCGYHETFNKLVSPAVTSAFNIVRQLPIPNSPGYVIFNIGFKGNEEQLNIPNCNIFQHPVNPENFDSIESAEKCMQDPFNEEPSAFITFGSVKDKAWPHPNLLTCQIFNLMEYKWFEKFRDQKPGARCEEYQALKKIWQEKCLEKVFRLYPQLRGLVDFIDISSPLSVEYYLEKEGGGIVGLDHTPARFVDWEIRKHLNFVTPVSGLYMTGQDIITTGFLMAQMSGVMTALKVLGVKDSVLSMAFAVRTILQYLFLQY